MTRTPFGDETVTTVAPSRPARFRTSERREARDGLRDARDGLESGPAAVTVSRESERHPDTLTVTPGPLRHKAGDGYDGRDGLIPHLSTPAPTSPVQVPPVRTDPTVDETVASDLDYRRKHLFRMPPPTRTGPHGEEMQAYCGKWFEVRRLKQVWGPSPEHCPICDYEAFGRRPF
jgi:hypothetical protein